MRKDAVPCFGVSNGQGNRPRGLLPATAEHDSEIRNQVNRFRGSSEVWRLTGGGLRRFLGDQSLKGLERLGLIGQASRGSAIEYHGIADKKGAKHVRERLASFMNRPFAMRR